MLEQLDAYICNTSDLQRLAEIEELLQLRIAEIMRKKELIIQLEAGV